MTPRARVVIAGTAGGVGTTTVTSLLFAALGANIAGGRATGSPTLSDHSGGELGLRLPEGDEATTLDPDLLLHDIGPHASGAALDLLADPSVLLVVVTPATPAGLIAAERVLRDIKARHETAGLRRTLVACVGVFGRHRVTGEVEKLENAYGRRSIAVLPQDYSLAAGGRVPLTRLTAETRRAQKLLATMLRERLATHVSS